jgi:DHA2 family multidrug resistance protein
MPIGEARRLDVLSLALLAMALAALEVALKEASTRGWTSGLVAGLLALSFASSVSFVRRTLNASRQIVTLGTFADRSFAIGCVMSFVLGLGPFGSVYLMPVFLALVRGYNALKSGAIMLVRLASFKPNRKGSHRDADSARSVFAESLF